MNKAMKKFTRGFLVVALVGISGFLLVRHQQSLTPAQQGRVAARQASWMMRAVMPFATSVSPKIQPPMLITGPRMAPLPAPEKADLSRIPRYSDSW